MLFLGGVGWVGGWRVVINSKLSVCVCVYMHAFLGDQGMCLWSR